jgi:hypothetical protein
MTDDLAKCLHFLVHEYDAAPDYGMTLSDDEVRYISAHIKALEAENARYRAALDDMWSGWRYIRMVYGDLPGVGWERCDEKARAALTGKEPSHE